jgi:hypothetical protein
MGALVALAVLSAAPALAADRLEIVTLSNRPDKLSGGDVLVKVVVPAGTRLGDVRVSLNGTDVTGPFWQDAGRNALVGLVTGMPEGLNKIRAQARGVGADTLEVRNHSITGPVFAGPHETPFFCQTHQFRLYPNGPFLTASQIDDPCHVPTRVDYVYRSTAGTFKAFDPSAPLPADLARIPPENIIPYIVRLETGTINRAIYQIAILDNPTIPGPDLRNHADPGWNGRLVYTFGGGCRAGWYRQGSSTGGVLDNNMLSKGFAVASASLNVFGNNCSDLLAAETMMMVKEHFVEAYGLPRYTIGWGCSGGSYQVHQIGDNYPGLLDGIVPQCSFPDVNFATIHTLSDARLLYNYYLNGAAVPWTQEGMRAVSGFGVFNSIPNLADGAARIDPVPNRDRGTPELDSSAEFNAIVPGNVRFDPVTNSAGARPTTYDHTVNAFGRDEQTGFARRPLDNVGIQYGLAALNAGQISQAQFLDLNANIGGFDVDANFVPERMRADRHAMKAAYETGRLTNGGGGLGATAILDFDLIYSDLAPGGDIHMKFQHFSMRARLRKANGHADNHVMWSGADGARSAFVSSEALTQIDAWLGKIVADTSSDPLDVKVVRNKPASLVDGCWTGGTGGAPVVFHAEPHFLGGPGTSFCNSSYPGFSSPRMVAGGPLTNDIIKCQLKRIDPADYAVTFTSEEIARLHQIFPRGVCDWSRPGVEQRALADTWITFTDVGKYRRDEGDGGD